MKKVLSLVLALSVAASLMTGSFALSAEEAYDDTYVYVMTEQSLETTSDVEITESTNGEYISLITSDLNEDNNIDPWVAVMGISVPHEYQYMAVKYAGASNTSFDGNNHYVTADTEPALGWGQPGSFTAPNMTADNAWHLKIYSVSECFQGVGEANITSVRLRVGIADGGETRIAYIGFFKSEAEASAYDAAYCAANTLDDMPPPERTEVIPEALDAVPEYTFDFNDLEAAMICTAFPMRMEIPSVSIGRLWPETLPPLSSWRTTAARCFLNFHRRNLTTDGKAEVKFLSISKEPAAPISADFT